MADVESNAAVVAIASAADGKDAEVASRLIDGWAGVVQGDDQGATGGDGIIADDYLVSPRLYDG